MTRPTAADAGANSDGAGVRSPAPFALGFAAAVGVGLAYLIFRSIVNAHDILILVALALFFATGLDPLVRLVQRSGLKRGPSVGVVFLLLLGMFAAFGFVVVPPLVDQTTAFVHNLPGYVDDLQRNRTIARLDSRVHLLGRAHDYVSSGSIFGSVAGNVVQAGTTVATSVFEGFSVLILTLYFMAYLDGLLEFAYRLVPRSRRERAELIGDGITTQLGAYVAGNLAMGLLAGLVALGWLEAIRAPYPFALAFVVGILDVLPLLGAPVAAIVVSIVVLLHSVPLGMATVAFFVVYQVVENYLRHAAGDAPGGADQPGGHHRRRAGRLHAVRRHRVLAGDPAGRGTEPALAGGPGTATGRALTRPARTSSTANARAYPPIRTMLSR